MNQTDFGNQLRALRSQTINPQTQKPLTQQKLGELLGLEMGDHGFSGAAVSDWERSQSKIDVNTRVVLLSLIKILKRHGGIKSSASANSFLESGNYRALNLQEKVEIFPEEKETDLPGSTLQFFPGLFHFITPAELERMRLESKHGPPSATLRFLVLILNKITSQITAQHILRMILWVWIWFFAYLLLSPSLAWGPAFQENPLEAIGLYAVGTLVLPLFVGGMTNTKNTLFWQQRLPNQNMLRLYVHQGAFVGFHVGYFVVLLFSFVQSLLNLQPVIFIEALNTAFPIAVAYAGTQLVPYNLWMAYGRLRLKDGWIFFIFALLGPLWAYFFHEFYQVLTSRFMGAFLLLVAITLIVWQASKKRML